MRTEVLIVALAVTPKGTPYGVQSALAINMLTSPSEPPNPISHPSISFKLFDKPCNMAK